MKVSSVVQSVGGAGSGRPPLKNTPESHGCLLNFMASDTSAMAFAVGNKARSDSG